MFNDILLKLQPIKPKKGGKKTKIAPAPLAAKKVPKKAPVNPLIEKRPKNFGIGVKSLINYLNSIILLNNISISCTRIFSRSGYSAKKGFV